MNNGIKVMNNDEIRDFCIKKELKIFELEQQLAVSEYEIEKYKDIVLDLENEKDILKSKLSETKADIHYLLENGESIYIRTNILEVIKMNKIYLYIMNIETKAKFFKYFETEHEKDKFKRRLKYIPYLMLIEDSSDMNWNYS